MIETWLEKKISNKWLRYNIQYLLLGLVIGSFLNVLFWVISSHGHIDCRNVLMTYVVSTLITLSITNIYIFSAYFIKHKFSSPLINILLSYLVMVFGVVAGTELSFIFVSLIYDTPFGQIDHLGHLKFNVVIGFIVVTLMNIYQLQSDSYNLKIKEKEVQLLKLNELKTQAELRTLQARINPHFLYNALNSITSLIHDEPDKAEKMTLSLSKLFRYSLNTQDANFSSIKEELDIVQTYLDIEKVRFNDRIKFEILNDESLNDYLIPRFLLQPLVENALKHGLANIGKDGLLEISVVDKGDMLEIIVHDNGNDFPEDLTAGYGLQSTNDKLNLLYGDNWKLNYTNTPKKQISISIPKSPIV